MFEILLHLIEIGIGVWIGVLRLGTPHLCLDKSKNDETTLKMFEILLLLVKIKFGITVLILRTLDLCLNKGRNDNGFWCVHYHEHNQTGGYP
jgi:hypothetical protein